MRRSLQGFTNAAMDRIVAHEWTGNVRELENEIERIVALAGPAERVTLDMLSEHIRGAAPAPDAPAPPDGPREWNLNAAVDDLKRRLIVDAVQLTGSKTRAAQTLGIPRQSLQKMMKRLGLGESS